MDIVSVHEAKTHFSKLLIRAHAGEGSVTDPFFDPLPDEELDSWES